MSTSIFNREQIIKYAETRLFGENLRPENVRKIELHNGILPGELEKIIRSRTTENPITVLQKNPREPLFFHDSVLYIPQYSGVARRQRYEDMIEQYKNASGANFVFESLELHNDKRATVMEYDNFAYDFAKKLFLNGTMDGISTIIIGRTAAVEKQFPVEQKFNSEYLDSQIIKNKNTKVLNINELYGDQAGRVLEHLTLEYCGHSTRGRLPLRFLIFSRVGALADGTKRQDIVYPTGIIESLEMEKYDTVMTHPMHNALVNSDGISGLNLNVSSVIGETKEILEKAKKLGCVSVDMEISETVGMLKRATTRYHKQMDITLGVACYVSDKPLEGDTLADELTSDFGEQKAVSQIQKFIDEK